MSLTLTENHAQNGPLMLVPGSHRHYITCVGETPDAYYRHSLQRQDIGVPEPQEVGQLIERLGLVTIEAKPGSVILFDCNTMHGSNGNISPWPRSNAFFVYNALCNALHDPYGTQPPRPEFIASRESMAPVTPMPAQALSAQLLNA